MSYPTSNHNWIVKRQYTRVLQGLEAATIESPENMNLQDPLWDLIHQFSKSQQDLPRRKPVKGLILIYCNWCLGGVISKGHVCNWICISDVMAKCGKFCLFETTELGGQLTAWQAMTLLESISIKYYITDWRVQPSHSTYRGFLHLDYSQNRTKFIFRRWRSLS